MARAGAFALPSGRDEKTVSHQPDTQSVFCVAAALQFDPAASGPEAGAGDGRGRQGADLLAVEPSGEPDLRAAYGMGVNVPHETRRSLFTPHAS